MSKHSKEAQRKINNALRVINAFYRAETESAEERCACCDKLAELFTYQSGTTANPIRLCRDCIAVRNATDNAIG